MVSTPDFFIFFLVLVVLVVWTAYDVVTPAPAQSCSNVDMAIFPDQCIPHAEGFNAWLIWFGKKIVFITGLMITLSLFRTRITQGIR